MSFNAKDMTRGGRIASMRIRMFSQIANIIVYCLVILFGIIVAITLSVKLTRQTFVNGMVYYWCQTLAPCAIFLNPSLSIPSVITAMS